mmetsp:Transcript_147193/g.260193  ORF Transcript_147193/g.260193 Transcript_147193/m.260193 type:complete len:648 (-) Transcript_147193:64-2007(-)
MSVLAKVGGKKAGKAEAVERPLTEKELAAVDSFVLDLVQSKFPGWSERQLNTKKRKFKHYEEDTLTGTLKQIKLEKGKKGRIAPAMICQIKTVWADEEDVPVFTPGAADEAVDPQFKVALAHASLQNPAQNDKRYLYGWFALKRTLHYKECIALLRHLSTVDVSFGTSGAKHCLEVMRYLVEQGAFTKWADETNKLKKQFETAHCTLCKFQMANGHTNQQYWNENELTIAQVIDSTMVRKVFTEVASLTNVYKEVKVLTASSTLGFALFGTCMLKLAKENFQTTLSAEVASLYSPGVKTDAIVTAVRDKLAQAVNDVLAAAKDQEVTYEVEPTFRGIQLKKVKVSCLFHCQLELAKWAKTASLGHKDGLPANQFELCVLPPTPFAAGVACPVPESMVKEFKKGRDGMNKLVSDRGVKSGQKMLDEDKTVFLSTLGDPTMRDLDIALLRALLRNGGVSTLKQELLGLLPSADHDKTFQQVIDGVAVLKAGASWQFVTHMMTAPLSAAMSLVEEVQRGRLTRIQYLGLEGFEKEVGERLPLFAVRSIKDHKGRAKTLRGQTAVDNVFDGVSAQDQEHSADDLEFLVQFKFLLEARRFEQVEEWSKSAAVVTHKSAVQSSTKTKNGSAAKRSAEQSDWQQALSHVEDLFK